jgi:hypothetical protein
MRLLGVVLLGYQLVSEDGVQSFTTTTNHHGTLHHWSITSCQPDGVGLWFHNHNHHDDDNDDSHSRRLGTGRISWLRVDDKANDSLLQWPTISRWKGRKWYGTRFAAVLEDGENDEEASFFRDNYNDDDDDDDDNDNNNVVVVLQEKEKDGETFSSKNDIREEEEEEEEEMLMVGDMDMTLPTNEDLATLTPGTSDGFFIVKHYKSSLLGDSFDWDMLQAMSSSSSSVLNDKDIERLGLTPRNMSLPVALMLLDPQEYPSQSKARKACRKASILIHRGPLLRHPESLSRSEQADGEAADEEEAETWFDPEKCIRGHVGDRIYPGGNVSIYHSPTAICFLVVVASTFFWLVVSVVPWGTLLQKPNTIILSRQSSHFMFHCFV